MEKIALFKVYRLMFVFFTYNKCSVRVSQYFQVLHTETPVNELSRKVLQFNFPLHAVWKYAYYSYFVWYIFTLPFITGNRTLIRQHTTPVLNHWSWLFVVVWNIYGGFETTNFRLRIQRSLHWATYQWVFKLWQRVWIIYRLSACEAEDCGFDSHLW